MKSLCILILAIGLASAFKNGLHPLSDENIAEINSKQSTWTAGRNFEIDEYPLFKVLASGVKKPRGVSKQARRVVHDENEDVPETFDAREAWPECADVIGLIRDQSRCAASYAFGAVGAMSDRICIHSKGAKKALVSAQDLISCGGVRVGSCDGGINSAAWDYWNKTGIVTGGLYNRTDQGCKSYSLPECDDHMNNCLNFGETPACVKQCDDATLSYEKQRTYGLEYYEIYGEKQIQLEIMKNGPVEGAMDVYTDFANYKSGIYNATTDDFVGTHGLRIVGWGVENGVKYWLIANSWNEHWGENGYYRIIRGQNEANIEFFVDAGLPDFSRF